MTNRVDVVGINKTVSVNDGWRERTIDDINDGLIDGIVDRAKDGTLDGSNDRKEEGLLIRSSNGKLEGIWDDGEDRIWEGSKEGILDSWYNWRVKGIIEDKDVRKLDSHADGSTDGKEEEISNHEDGRTNKGEDVGANVSIKVEVIDGDDTRKWWFQYSYNRRRTR